MDNEQNENPPSYEEANTWQFKDGMCSNKCGMHATNILSKDMGKCPSYVLKVAMCKIVYECMELCTDEEKIDISDTYMTCIGNVDVPRRSVMKELPSRMGGLVRMEWWDKSKIGAELVRVAKNWNECHYKLLDNAGNSDEVMYTQQTIISPKALRDLLSIPLDLAMATDVINNLEMDTMMVQD